MERASSNVAARIISLALRTIAGLGMLAIALTVFIALIQTRPQPKPADISESLPRVLVVKVKPVPVRREWEGFGTVRAMMSTDVPARVTAIVVNRPSTIHAGQPIAVSQLIAQLDDSDFISQSTIIEQNIIDIDAQLVRLDVEEASWKERVALAVEEVSIAKAEMERIQRAFQSNAATQREIDTARQTLIASERNLVIAREQHATSLPQRMSLQAKRDSQNASLQLARKNIERCRIVSPLDGFLQEVDVELGENLTTGQRVARVVNMNRVEVPLLLPSSAQPFIRVDDDVTLTTTGSAQQSIQASVTRINPEQDVTTRTMTVYVEIQQDALSTTFLAPGMFVRGVVQVSHEESRFVVPRRAIANERVTIVSNEYVTTREVDIDFHLNNGSLNLGVPDQQWVVLKNSLPMDALVVVDASRTLAEGTRVTPVIADEVVAELSQDELPHVQEDVQQ